MLRALPKSFFLGVFLLAAILAGVVQSLADDKPVDRYNVSGSVLSAISKRGHFYQVATENRIYMLMCTRARPLGLGMLDCRIGDKPIAAGDTVKFRVDGDWAYMPVIGQEAEDKLRILTTELKTTPVVPTSTPLGNTSSANTKGSKATPEPGIVIGTGMHVKGQKGAGWSTTPGFGVASSAARASAAAPGIAMGPVVAVPVTGGAPVVMMPTGPAMGGVVTGVPVTGGAPITGIPVSGAPGAGGAVMMGGGGPPPWVHVLRIQTAGKIYQLECSRKPCMLENKEIGLGDSLALRVDKKHAYLSGDPRSSGAEEKLKILSVTDVGSGPDAKED